MRPASPASASPADDEVPASPSGSGDDADAEADGTLADVRGVPASEETPVVGGDAAGW